MGCYADGEEASDCQSGELELAGFTWVALRLSWRVTLCTDTVLKSKTSHSEYVLAMPVTAIYSAVNTSQRPQSSAQLYIHKKPLNPPFSPSLLFPISSSLSLSSPSIHYSFDVRRARAHSAPVHVTA